MKNITITILLCAFFIDLSAQNTFSLKQNAAIATKIDSVLLAYFELSTITKKIENVKTDNKETSSRIANYKSLFSKDAIIFDDINAKFVANPSKGASNYQLEEKALNDYISGLIEEFPTGLIIFNKRLNISYDDYISGIVTVALERTISGTTYTQNYNFFNHDTLKLTLSTKEGPKKIKITKIESLGYKFNVLNDKDYDGVIDKNDECIDVKGPAALNGCPDTDNDGIVDKDDDCPTEAGPKDNRGCPLSTFTYRYVFSGSAGIGFSKTNLTMNEDLSKTNYKNYRNGLNNDAENASAGEFGNIDYQFGFNLNALIGAYFGKTKGNRNKGVSLGIMWTNYNQTYTLNNVRYYFEAKDKEGVGYERRLTLQNGSTEKINFNYFSFPLLFKYKSKIKFNEKFAWEIGAGPSLLYSRATLQEVNATMSFEGVYYSDGNKIDAYAPNRIGTNSDIRIIASEVDASTNVNSNEAPNSTALFSSLRNNGYDFDANKKIENIQGTAINRFGLAFNATGDIFYHISAKAAIKVGAAYFYGIKTLSQGSSEYLMIVKGEKGGDFSDDHGSNGDYKSIYNSNLKRENFSSFGINAGIILGL